VLAGVLTVALAAAAVVLFLEPFGGDEDEKRSVPSGAVAVAGDEEISRADFDHWLRSSAQSQHRGAGVAIVPDPPSFERCVATKRDDPSEQGAGDDELRARCRQEYESLRDQVMQFLISAAWIELEAEDRGIDVADAEVRRQFEDQKEQSFENERDYQEFLRTSGQSEEDVLYRVHLDILSNKIREEVVSGKQGDEQQRALDSFVEDFETRYREMTVCAEDFVMSSCSNGPQPEKGTGTSTVPGPAPPGR
jgi:foldase protein PrsA